MTVSTVSGIYCTIINQSHTYSVALYSAAYNSGRSIVPLNKGHLSVSKIDLSN